MIEVIENALVESKTKKIKKIQKFFWQIFKLFFAIELLYFSTGI